MSEKMESEISDRILEILGSSVGPLMAAEIAKQLRAMGYAHLKKSGVSHILRRCLTAKVRQDPSHYSWSLTDPHVRADTATVTSSRMLPPKTVKYTLPPVLTGKCSEKDYVHWLTYKAAAHVRRDQKRGNTAATTPSYRAAIHAAVCSGGHLDAYTGKPLDWGLIRKYNNKDAKAGGRAYKKKFANLPTVDHVGDGKGPIDLKICSWRLNDCKSDLTLEEFVEVCKTVLEFNRLSDHTAGNAGHGAFRKDLDGIIGMLFSRGRAASSGAVAALLGVLPRALMQGRPRNPFNSWVVDTDHNRPTGYEIHEIDSRLESSIDEHGVLDSPTKLDDWLGHE